MRLNSQSNMHTLLGRPCWVDNLREVHQFNHHGHADAHRAQSNAIGGAVDEIKVRRGHQSIGGRRPSHERGAVGGGCAASSAVPKYCIVNQGRCAAQNKKWHVQMMPRVERGRSEGGEGGEHLRGRRVLVLRYRAQLVEQGGLTQRCGSKGLGVIMLLVESGANQGEGMQRRRGEVARQPRPSLVRSRELALLPRDRAPRVRVVAYKVLLDLARRRNVAYLLAGGHVAPLLTEQDGDGRIR